MAVRLAWFVFRRVVIWVPVVAAVLGLWRGGGTVAGGVGHPRDLRGGGRVEMSSEIGGGDGVDTYVKGEDTYVKGEDTYGEVDTNPFVDTIDTTHPPANPYDQFPVLTDTQYPLLPIPNPLTNPLTNKQHAKYLQQQKRSRSRVHRPSGRRVPEVEARYRVPRIVRERRPVPPSHLSL